MATASSSSCTSCAASTPDTDTDDNDTDTDTTLDTPADTTVTTLLQPLQPSSSLRLSSARPSSGHAPRRSLTLFSRIPKEFASLVRSHTSSRRDRPRINSQHHANILFSAYAGPDTAEPPSRHSVLATMSRKDDDRPARNKQRSENRLYNFLTRSRSRSRSKNDNDPPTPADPPQLPQLQLPGNIRHSSIAPGKNKNLPAMPSSKPQSRIQSRPLSSTTTATSTTITPGTPKARRNPASPIPLPASPSRQNDRTPSRPTTPKPSATRKTLHNLFGIPLRKSSRSRSRPSSPRPSLDVPPLPGVGHDDDPTPKPLKSIARPQSPSPNPLTTSVNSTSSTGPSIKLPKFFSARSAPLPDIHPLQRRPSNPVAPPSSAPAVVSAPQNRHHRHSIKPDHTVAAPIPSPSASQITHTPSTSPDGIARQLTSRHNTKNVSLDAGYRYRGGAMGVVDEEGRGSADIRRSHSAKGKAKETVDGVPAATARASGQLKMSNSARSTKHGSFDFERPGWGATMMQRSGSNDTTGTSGSIISRVEKERESAFGPGLAGVGTLQRDVSIKRLNEREENLKSRDMVRKKKVQRDVGPSPVQSDHANASTSTNGTAQTGKSSSMSRATGKKSQSNGGGGRLGLSTQHGLFDFEPPVPSPTWSTGSTGTTGHEVSTSWSGRGEKEKERLRVEMERQKERKGAQRGDRPAVPVPIPSKSNAGHRSGTKGRSLDLGLGLAWAPNKVREEALLPSSTFFQRSLSNSSSTGRSASMSTNDRSVSSSTNDHNNGRSRIPKEGQDAHVERTKVGREVAVLFRNALDDDGYAAFKKYVHQFDAHEIPFDGATGITTRVERLLATSRVLDKDAKQQLLDGFIKIILQTA